MNHTPFGIGSRPLPPCLTVRRGQPEAEPPFLHLELLAGDLGVVLDHPAAFGMLRRELGHPLSQIRILCADVYDRLDLVKPDRRFLLCFFQSCFQKVPSFRDFHRLKSREILIFSAGGLPDDSSSILQPASGGNRVFYGSTRL